MHYVYKSSQKFCIDILKWVFTISRDLTVSNFRLFLVVIHKEDIIEEVLSVLLQSCIAELALRTQQQFVRDTQD